MESLEGALAAEQLELVDPLVTAVVARVGETLGVLVGQDGAVGLHNRARGQVLQIIQRVNIQLVWDASERTYL